MPYRRVLIFLLLSCVLGACATVQVGTEFQSGRSALLTGKPDVALVHFRRAAEVDPGFIHESSSLREGIWSYVGRSYYETGQLPEAEEALKQALSRNEKHFVARLYLGLTLLRMSGDAVPDNSLTLQQIVFALKERVTPRRLASMVKERGVQFALTEETERDLRRQGADNELVEQIRSKSAGVIRPEQGLREIDRALREIDAWLEYTAGTPQGRFWDPAKKIRSQVRASLAVVRSKKLNRQELINGGEWVGKALEEEIDLARRDEQEQRRKDQKR